MIKGFDNYLNTRIPKNQNNKRPKIENIERLFSLTSVKSKTSEAVEEGALGDKSEFQNKIVRMRNNKNKGKIYNRDDGESIDNNSASADDPSIDEFNRTNNKGGRRNGRKG